MTGGTISISWGRYGGFYASFYRQTNLNGGRYWRLCGGWVALTYLPVDLDDVLRSALDAGEVSR
jgi:hypothetical protein